MKIKKISVIGLGYIGLPTAALLSSNGYKVLGADVNSRVVEIINEGKVHIVEPDLEPFVCSAVDSGMLQAFLEPQAGDVYMICVPTPFQSNSDIPTPNLDFVISAVKSISIYIKPNDLVILESTSPVGTTEKIRSVLVDEGVDVQQVHIAYCPERVLPGKIMTELVENDRIVGGLTEMATIEVSKFYRTFVRGEVLETTAKTAEMAKLTENSFRDVNIAFANELSMICDREGIDVWELIRLTNRHPRVNILQPGVGVGGHCIAVDPWFIVARDRENSRLIRTARQVNNYKAQWVIDQIKLAVVDLNIKINKKPKIACLGLAFKPDIDDLRESPALDITHSLSNSGFDVLAVEPNIESHKTLQIVDLSEALKTSDLVVILVKHREFLQPLVQKNLRDHNVLDFCGALSN